jgi:hypothetical protein
VAIGIWGIEVAVVTGSFDGLGSVNLGISSLAQAGSKNNRVTTRNNLKGVVK